MTSAISPSKASSSQPIGRSTTAPSVDSVDGGFRKYEGNRGVAPRSAARLR